LGLYKTFVCRSAFALALATPLIAAAQVAAPFKSEIPSPRIDYWQKRAADIARQLDIRLVFVGDSITDFWHLDANPWFPGKYCGRVVWDESFGGAVPTQAALNLGVSGDRIEHVLHRLLPAVQGGQGWLDRRDLQPDTVFVMLGINNSFDSENPATTSIYRGVLKVVARIHERRPAARIVIQSLLPTDDDRKNRELVLPVNDQLRAFAARSKGIDYLDLYRLFVDANGAQQRTLFNDSLHPSRDGYRVWRDRLVEFLRAR
jgi:lysophospholipase L1-like esterase